MDNTGTLQGGITVELVSWVMLFQIQCWLKKSIKQIWCFVKRNKNRRCMGVVVFHAGNVVSVTSGKPQV